MSNFNWPVGLPDERSRFDKLPGAWITATDFAQYYEIRKGVWNYHTGLDLNLNVPKFDADAHLPVYAAYDGQVAWAEPLPVWGMVITIRHEFQGVPLLWTRYAHGESLKVIKGQWVKQGDQLCNVGNADGRYPYHLHYDISLKNLETWPGDWPGTIQRRVYLDYIDPIRFMHDQISPNDPGAQMTRRRVIVDTLRVRKEANTQSAIVGRLMRGVIVLMLSEREGWGLIAQPPGWIALQYTELVV
jgi:murein DD-endopeptidase MepM/ murein hydrolase activator NlpD